MAGATGQSPGGRTSEGPAGTAGKSADLASGGHVQNNQPSRPARTRPGARRPLSPGAAKLGAEGHGYFWAGLAARHSPPVPPKSQGKRGSRGGSQPHDARPLPGVGVLPGDPTLPPFRKPIGIISMSGSHWPHRAVPGLLGHESLCWALGHTKNHNCPQHTGALLSAGEALTVAGTPCAHTGTPCPPGTPTEKPALPLITHSLQPGALPASCGSPPPP